ncbi:S8 family serine peptidase [Bacillus sp. AFS088145]|uniref:S8 family serine peptidase n=1 Tax=Bacillus sp. AFS088145 TaxID=2033514 RepID=UPI000BF758BA|nr:S8 family serine peptidase [Bacillus sp. AFS088145]PFH87741.1 peptidase S8 [Bacillus sp. AFS088145]
MKKMKSKKILNVMVTGVLATSFMTTYLLPHQKTYAITNSAEAIIKGLTDEQRQSLNRLTPEDGFIIDPSLTSSNDVQSKIIVELNTAPIEDSAASVSTRDAKSKKEKIQDEQAYFKQRVEEMFKSKDSKSSYSITRSYENVFNGVAMTIPTSQINALLDTGVVKRIWKDNIVQLPKSESIAQPVSNSKELPAPLPFLGVDKLHNENINGQGIKVGVIDTGIDYNHPDLKDAYKGGYDFVDNDSDPMETTLEDWKKSGEDEIIEGRSFYTDHGTHVSGTIAANPENTVDYAMTGVAPKVELNVYRVLGHYGSGSDSSVIAGVEKAVADGMQVINLSLGNDENNSLSATSVAINNAALMGVVTVIAGGNTGPNPGTLGSPGASPLAITVGASDVPTDVPSVTTNLGDTKVPSTLLGHGMGKDYLKVIDQDYHVVNVGIGTEADYSGKDLTGKVALISRGTLTFDEKIKRAHEKGAVAVLIYNNVTGEIPYYLGENLGYLPSFKMLQSDGDKLVTKLNENPDSTVRLSNLQSNMSSGDVLADFSSRGPVSNNFDIKPDVVAPGVTTFSTIPEYINSPADGVDYTSAYANFDGTSMATPHVAGVAALLLQSHPNYTVADVKATLMNTAVPLKGRTYNVNEVGAGRIDAFAAVHNTTLLEVQDKTVTLDEFGSPKEIDDITGSIAYGSIASSTATKTKTTTIKVSNLSNQNQKYTTSVEYLTIDGVSKNAEANKVSIGLPNTFEVNSNSSINISATLTLPSNAEIGNYQGYIHVRNESNTSDYRIPFHVRYTDGGIEFVDFYQNAITNDYSVFHPWLVPYTPARFQLRSPLKTIDMIIKDLNGNPIGLVGTINADGLAVDTPYSLRNAFSGDVKRFTGDSKKPISDEYTMLDEGRYIISFIGTDSTGKTFKIDNDMVIDNTAPKVTYDKTFGIHELTNADLTTEKSEYDGKDYKAYWVHGKVYDDTIEYLKSKGHAITQAANNVIVYQDDDSFPTDYLVPNENGDFKFGVLPDEYNDQPTTIDLFSFDYATASNINLDRYIMMKKGTQYAQIKGNNQAVGLGTEFTTTFSVNNPIDLTSARTSIDVPHLFKIMNVKPTQELKDLAAKNKWTIRVAKPEIKSDTYSDMVTYGVDLFDTKTNLPIKLNNSINLLDITMKVVDDLWFYGKATFYSTESSYKTNEGKTTSVQTFADSINLISKHSYAEGYFRGEAIKLGTKLDYSTIGIKAFLVDSKGNKYKATISKIGKMVFADIPVTEELYTLVVNIPGHYTFSNKIKLSRKIDGELQGNYYSINMATTAAGDVNDDNVIDIYDAKLIANKAKVIGVNLKEDLNKDGVVDIKDFSFVEKNFMTTNPYFPTSITPIKSTGKITLEELKKSFN